MKIFRNSVLLLLPLLLCSCGKPQEGIPDSTDAPTEGADWGDIQVTVETVQISPDALKAADYTVPVRIRLDKNSGISYSEWGVQADAGCVLSVDEENDESDFGVYYAVSDSKDFLWTAWATSSKSDTNTGILLTVDVKVPEDAASGDFYGLRYADTSMADKAHIWKSTDADWVSADSVTWTDGGISIE